ncbi:MAG: peptidyl-prolyl cis-trans isomerase [Armatimonadota bacterium]|nr:peptidyl-prolyl cis-trans isomerase [bacterium]
MHRTRFSLIVLMALAALATVLSGCGRGGIVKVNGEKVSKDEFYKRLEMVPVQTQQGAKMAGQYVIEQIIAEKLVEQLAKEQGVTPTKEQIDKKIAMIKKENGGDINKVLQQRGLTMEDFNQQLMVQQALVNVVSKGVKVPDSKVKAAYDQALNAPNSPFKRPEQVMVSVIVSTTKDKSDKAYGLLKTTDFGTVAMQLSEDPTAKASRGRLSWVSQNMQQVPKPVRDTAFTLPVGKYSSPFKVGSQWIILRADQKREAKTQNYNDVKDMIREQLEVNDGAKKNNFRGDLQKFTQKANIVINVPRYKGVADNIKKQAAQNLTGQLNGAKPAAMPAK